MFYAYRRKCERGTEMELPIGKVISDLRKKNGVTQEQLADAVGVSVPAVSKWETGNSYPDVTLLMPIARYLGATVDDLFRYECEIPPERVLEIERECAEAFEAGGFEAGLALCDSSLREYPNNLYLKFRVACLLPWYAAKCGGGEETTRAALEKAAGLLKAAGESREEKIRDASLYMLACTCAQMDRCGEAREILEKLPRNEADPDDLLPSVYLQQGELEKAKKLDQKNLIRHVENASIALTGLAGIAMREEKWEDALAYADAQRGLIGTFRLEKFLRFSNCQLYLFVYSRKGDAEKTLFYLKQSLSAFPYEMDRLRLSDIFFFDMLETQRSSLLGSFTKDTVIRGLEEDRALDFLRGDARFRNLMEDFRNGSLKGPGNRPERSGSEWDSIS